MVVLTGHEVKGIGVDDPLQFVWVINAKRSSEGRQGSSTYSPLSLFSPSLPPFLPSLPITHSGNPPGSRLPQLACTGH